MATINTHSKDERAKSEPTPHVIRPEPSSVTEKSWPEPTHHEQHGSNGPDFPTCGTFYHIPNSKG